MSRIFDGEAAREMQKEVVTRKGHRFLALQIKPDFESPTFSFKISSKETLPAELLDPTGRNRERRVSMRSSY